MTLPARVNLLGLIKAEYDEPDLRVCTEGRLLPPVGDFRDKPRQPPRFAPHLIDCYKILHDPLVAGFDFFAMVRQALPVAADLCANWHIRAPRAKVAIGEVLRLPEDELAVWLEG